MDGKPYKKKRLGDLLYEAGVVSREKLDEALAEQKRTGKRLGELLINCKIVSEADIAQTLASQLGFNYIDLAATAIEPEAISLIPESLARKNLAIPIYFDKKYLTVAMVDPLDYEAITDLKFYSNYEIRPVISTKKMILEAIDQYYYLNDSVDDIVKETTDPSEDLLIQMVPELTDVDLRDVEKKSQLAPIIRLLNLILTKAIKARASDIHIEPYRKYCNVRFRIDGILKEEMRLPKWVQGALTSRVKVLASLDIAERRLPQDGGIRVKAEQKEIDLRISTLPTSYGEKVVIRLLDQSRTIISLETLGPSKKDCSMIESFINRKKGIILVTGPTGSGKTTTLYALINRIKSEEINIITVEDPVEYSIEGINQIQVNPEIGLTFANSLRSILRQDPDVILIGEIRDLETAEIAFRAAMTGHLVLSTVHTNDAPSTITRLIHLGLPRYLVASLVVGVIAQRLVRCVCPRCKESQKPPVETLLSLRIPAEAWENAVFYYGRGCNYCHGTGYQGRMGLFEVLELTPKIRELILNGASEAEIRTSALAAKMGSLGEDGINKAKEGVTTIEELLRVIEVEEGLYSLCPRCGKSIHVDFLACPFCGEMVQSLCQHCSKPLQPEWLLCPYCSHEAAVKKRAHHSRE